MGSPDRPHRALQPLAAAALVFALATPGVGCANQELPDYAAPQARVVDPEELDLRDVIPYRALQRSDFKGTVPPPEVAAYRDKVGAATCAHIMTTPDTQVMVRVGRTPDGLTVYQAIPDRLRFQAGMERTCSWWNPDGIGLPEDYVLQHEQIHFALFELEARRLNAEIHEIEAALHTTGQSPEEAVARAQAQLDRAIQSRTGAILERSRRFDEDTSMGHRPQAQQRWWERVQVELAASEEHSTTAGAAGPGPADPGAP